VRKCRTHERLVWVGALPQPHQADAVVSNDLANRTLTVRLSDLANGYTKLLWRQSFEALRRSEEGGVQDRHPTIWASTPQAFQIAYATAGDAMFGGLLKFAFPSGDAYTRLISKPVTATVWIDKSRNRFITCNFKNRQS